MFHFPPHHQRAIHSHASDHQQRWPGFPIRTPSDHSPLVDSPRLNADRHVLLRPFMPRHPPNALKHLQKQTKNHNKPQFIATHTTNHKTVSHACVQDARIHYTIPKHHTNTPHQQEETSHQHEGGSGIEPKSLTACRACPKHPTTHTHNICMSDAGLFFSLERR